MRMQLGMKSFENIETLTGGEQIDAVSELPFLDCTHVWPTSTASPMTKETGWTWTAETPELHQGSTWSVGQVHGFGDRDHRLEFDCDGRSVRILGTGVTPATDGCSGRSLNACIHSWRKIFNMTRTS